MEISHNQKESQMTKVVHPNHINSMNDIESELIKETYRSLILARNTNFNLNTVKGAKFAFKVTLDHIRRKRREEQLHQNHGESL